MHEEKRRMLIGKDEDKSRLQRLKGPKSQNSRWIGLHLKQAIVILREIVIARCSYCRTIADIFEP